MFYLVKLVLLNNHVSSCPDEFTSCVPAGVGLIQHYIRGGKNRDDINKIVYQFCVSLKIQSPRVCEGLTELFGVSIAVSVTMCCVVVGRLVDYLIGVFFQGEVVHVLKRVSLGPEEICSFVIGDACGDVYNPFHEWKVIFPPVPKPEVPESKVPTVRNFALHIFVVVFVFFFVLATVLNFVFFPIYRKEPLHSKFYISQIPIMIPIIKRELMQIAMNHSVVD